MRVRIAPGLGGLKSAIQIAITSYEWPFERIEWVLGRRHDVDISDDRVVISVNPRDQGLADPDAASALFTWLLFLAEAKWRGATSDAELIDRIAAARTALRSCVDFANKWLVYGWLRLARAKEVTLDEWIDLSVLWLSWAGIDEYNHSWLKQLGMEIGKEEWTNKTRKLFITLAADIRKPTIMRAAFDELQKFEKR
jgi:hypothetical protein